MVAANSIWAYELMFGIARAGGVITALSNMLPPAVLTRLLDDSHPRLLFLGEGYDEIGAEAVETSASQPRIITQNPTPCHGMPFDEFVANSAGVWAGADREGDETFTVIYSSGTTGVPKGILHSVQGRLNSALSLAAACGVNAQSKSIISTPPYSNGTMIFLLPTLYLGGCNILVNTFDADAFYDLNSKYRPTHAFLVPTQFSSIFSDERIQSAELTHWRCLLSAGAPMPTELKAQVLRLAGHCYHELWGFTEGVVSLIYPSEARQRTDSVGRAFVGNEIRIIDEDDNELAPPATGELVGRSIAMMQGYLNRDDANREIEWRDNRGKIFLRTGDIGEIDSEGFVTLRGRSKDMIICGGFNVFPIDIEETLRGHASVSDAAVVGMPDDKWGEVPVAFVIPSNGAINSEDLRGWVNERVAKPQRLRGVIVSKTDFPRNALGKVLKNQLVEWLQMRGPDGSPLS
jgi:acyl-CoA synthetase (AMP-forming)/AMP-acid ligase II